MVLLKLISNKKIRINFENAFGNTLLHLAATYPSHNAQVYTHILSYKTTEKNKFNLVKKNFGERDSVEIVYLYDNYEFFETIKNIVL